GHEHFRIARYQWGAKGGWSIFEAMEPLVRRAVASGSLQVQLNTSAVDLIIGIDGAVNGIVAEHR
nr:hypothetical protein [Desulfuromonadales bacterium]